MNSSAKTLDEKFTTAWINIGRLPGSMMISTGPEGTHRYGPVATTTGCLITTSPTVVEEWRQQGKPVLEVALSGDSTAQETVDRLVNERIAGGVSRSFTPETPPPASNQRCTHVPLFAAGAGQIAREVTPCLRCEIERLRTEVTETENEVRAANVRADRIAADWTRKRAALNGLTNEVSAMLGIARHAMTETASLTNVRCLEHWRDQGRLALSGDSSAPETSCELERLRELQEKALALDDAVAEFGIDKPQYIAEAYQQFHDVLHDGHGSPSAVETAAPETSHDLFEATAMLADPNTMRIDIRFQNRADYEAAVVFFGMADSPEETSASVRDSIAPNIHCPVCDRWYWADKFDGHKCVAQKASACACRCHSSAGPNEGACIYCGHLPVNGKENEVQK